MALALAAGLAVRSGLATASGQCAYGFSVIATLGDAAPGGGRHEEDFEPQDINSSGAVLFVSDLDGGAVGEGLYLRRNGVTRRIARSGLSAPGTGTIYVNAAGVLTPSGLNDAGNVAFGFLLEPFSEELGVNAGVWRYTAATRALTPVLLPGQLAPGGTKLRGTWLHTDINNRDEIVTTGIIDTPHGNCTMPTAPARAATASTAPARSRSPPSSTPTPTATASRTPESICTTTAISAPWCAPAR